MDGLRVDGRCMSPEDALSKHFSAQPRAAALLSSGDTLETSYVPCTALDSQSMWCRRVQHFDTAGGLIATTTQAAQAPAFPSCDPLEGFWDGQAIGWGFAAVLIAVAAFRMMEEGAK